MLKNFLSAGSSITSKPKLSRSLILPVFWQITVTDLLTDCAARAIGKRWVKKDLSSFDKMIMFSNNNFSGNLDLLISKTDNSFATTNSLEVGFVEFEEERVENFSNYEIGYQTNSNFYLSEKMSMSLLSSRSKTLQAIF